MAMTPQEVRALVLSFPHAEEATAYGHPAYKAFGKFFTRVRDEDDSLVIPGVPIEEREVLIESDPELFHITPHYRNYPAVLARLSRLDEATARALLQRRWREVAPKKLLKSLEALSSG